MSAIFGVCDVSGASVDSDLVLRGRDAAWYRGSDAVGAFVEGHIGLGHRLLAAHETACEATRQPVTNGRGLWSIADSRLDNRADLESAFRAHGLWRERDLNEAASDAAYLLTAYELWGEEMPSHLLGDFAFAIWDKSHQRLFCARDHLGVRPFVYSWNGQRLIFASEPKQLLQDPSVSREHNLLHLADFACDIYPNKTETFYKAVSRLPGAHSLSIRGGGLRISRYWTWNPDREPKQERSTRENAEAFRAIFYESIAARSHMRGGNGRVAALLSGGLDSSSIASIAAVVEKERGSSAPFPVFTMLFPEADPAFQMEGMDPVDESAYARAVIEKHGLEPHWVRIENRSPLENLDTIAHTLDGPVSHHNVSYFDETIHRASQAGIKVLLYGGGGDEIFFPGALSLRRDLWRRGPGALFLDWSQWRRRGFSAARLVPYYFRELLLPASLHPQIRGPHRGFPPLWLNRRFARIHKYAHRSSSDIANKRWTHDSVNSGIHYMIESGRFAAALEAYNGYTAGRGIEGSLPFVDLRLMRFVASLPLAHKVRQNVSKYILRAAFKTDLPEKVLHRLLKTEFEPVIRSGVQRYASGMLRETFESPHPVLREIADPGAVLRVMGALFESAPTTVYDPSALRLRKQIWRLAMANLWLKTTHSDRISHLSKEDAKWNQNENNTATSRRA